MQEIYDNLIQIKLNKNTIGLIVDYLTDPPVLPYIKELSIKTQYLFNDFGKCIYYSTFFIITTEQIVITECCKFYKHRSGNWDIILKYIV